MYTACELDCNNEPTLATTILQEVVASATDKFPQKFRDIVVVKQILEEYSSDPDADENSNLKKHLGSCWRHGSFEKMRRLSEHSFATSYSSFAMQNRRNFVANACASELEQKSTVRIMFLCLPIDLDVSQV